LESSAIGKLLDASSRFWSVGPSLSETVYDGGLRRATVNQYIATYNADLAAYRQSVLTAFQQVEDSLAVGAHPVADSCSASRRRWTTPSEYLKLEQARYDTGLDPYIDLASAQDHALLGNEQAWPAADPADDGFGELIQALGGGWDKSQLPTPAQITPSRRTRIRHSALIQH
jgi:outer membrane protein TolC